MANLVVRNSSQIGLQSKEKMLITTHLYLKNGKTYFCGKQLLTCNGVFMLPPAIFSCTVPISICCQKITTQTCTIGRGISNFPHTFYLYLIENVSVSLPVYLGESHPKNKS